MKIRTLLTVILVRIALSASMTQAMTISGPLTSTQVNALATATDASYGPPPAVNYYEPGPLIVNSGTSVNLYAGPGPGQTDPLGNTIDTMLVTISLDPTSLTALGAGTISFDLTGVGTVTFNASDFFTTSAGGFPSSIGGIANGAVNGIKFPGADHAAFEISGLGLTTSTGTILDSATITSPEDLRLDIFGVASADTIISTNKRGQTITITTNIYPERIVNNTPNSGALGVTGKTVPDGGSTVLLLGAALSCFAMIGRKVVRLP